MPTRHCGCGGRRQGCPGSGRLVGGDLADQLGDRFALGGHLLRADVDAGFAHQCREVFALLGKNHGDDVACTAGARGAPRAVQISLVLGWWVHVHDQLDVVDVYTARGDVGGYQHACRAGAECGQVAVPRGLRQIAVQVN